MKKYIDFNTEIANIAKEFLKYVSKPTFISQKIVSEDFAATHETCYNKPIYVEFTVLELSIYLMYEYILNVKNLMSNYCLLKQTVLLMK